MFIFRLIQILFVTLQPKGCEDGLRLSNRSELHCVRLAPSLPPETKYVRIMTALQLNAELYRAIGEIAEDETLLAKVLKYVKSLVPAKTAKKEKAEEGWADRFCGAWKDDRSADEIVNDIRSARTANTIDVEL